MNQRSLWNKPAILKPAADAKYLPPERTISIAAANVQLTPRALFKITLDTFHVRL